MKYVIFILALSLGACASKDKAATPAKEDKAAAAQAADKKEAKAEKKATTSAGESISKVTCTIGGTVRTIEIKQNGGACHVEYTKDGATNVIGNGSAGTTFCQELQDRVKNNLSSAGYTCQ